MLIQDKILVLVQVVINILLVYEIGEINIKLVFYKYPLKIDANKLDMSDGKSYVVYY
jgi:hypothetical protein